MCDNHKVSERKTDVIHLASFSSTQEGLCDMSTDGIASVREQLSKRRMTPCLLLPTVLCKGKEENKQHCAWWCAERHIELRSSCIRVLVLDGKSPMHVQEFSIPPCLTDADAERPARVSPIDILFLVAVGVVLV